MNYLQIYNRYKDPELKGRYITLDLLEEAFRGIEYDLKKEVLGYSVEGRPIYGFRLGRGITKVLAWSQMHGNESTTTKSLVDLVYWLTSGEESAEDLLDLLSLFFIPMLNPDGAKKYTRENANGVDLNRDFVNLTQPESQLLLSVFNQFKPDYCFNLHDQRTIFAAGSGNKPATVSFLAPAFDEERSVNDIRLKAMNVIVSMNQVLQKYIPGQIGRFDDSFNRNCVGDAFQSKGATTILFEAGHFEGDYEREQTRIYIFIALLSGLEMISKNDVVDNKMDQYLKIPQNEQSFFDFIYRNVKISYEDSEIITNFAAQYKEELVEGKLVFNAYISTIGDLEGFQGHLEWDLKEQIYSDGELNYPIINKKADFIAGKEMKFVNGLLKA